MHNLHSNDIYHGDLKSSNVLLTTSNHLFLTDIASFKPYFIADDDQEDLRIFYTNSNLAPEKFVNSKDNQNLY